MAIFAMDSGFSNTLKRLFSRLLHLWFRLIRPMTLGVRCVAFDDAGRVLLVRHRYTPGWQFPGGGVDTGETLLAALRREIVEETGVQIVDTPKLHGIFHNVGVSKRDHVAVYVTRSIQVSPRPRTRLEISAADFFQLSDLPTDITEGTKRRLSELQDGSTPSETW